MDLQKLKTRINEVLAGQHDAEFLDIVNGVHCMSTPRVYAVINALVSAMEPGEIYCEVGCYQGGSMIAALRNNEAQAIGVDSFGEFQATNNAAQTQANFERFGVAQRVVLRDLDYQTFFSQAGADFKIQVYYYDGAHGYDVQLAGMEAGWPFLRPGSFIVVDDFSYSDVMRAVNQFVANHIDRVSFHLVVATEATNPPDSTWWNGVVVLEVH
jgi:protein O-GlcNAc transferase